MDILKTTDLHHDFSGMKVLFGIDLKIMEGEIHAVIGPNGAGKTTLFNCITGTYRPSNGKVFFKGNDITGYPPHKLARMGIGRSFQITTVFINLTTFQNVRLAVLSKRQIRFNLFQYVDRLQEVTEETEEILRRVNLIEERNILASELSYGKLRTLELALAFATEPELVFLDEFVAGMSRDEIHMAMDLVSRLATGRTVVLIEHDMDVVFSLADRITVLHYGRIIATGTPMEIKSNQDVRDAYLGDLEV